MFKDYAFFKLKVFKVMRETFIERNKVLRFLIMRFKKQLTIT